MDISITYCFLRDMEIINPICKIHTETGYADSISYKFKQYIVFSGRN